MWNKKHRSLASTIKIATLMYLHGGTNGGIATGITLMGGFCSIKDIENTVNYNFIIAALTLAIHIKYNVWVSSL